MIELLPRIPQYMAFRRWGWPRMLPLNLVASVTYRCNSRCRTCRVWQREAQEMTLEEWGKVFASIGTAPYYLTFSGGEPFLRDDLADLVLAACRVCRPGVITIPTNGLLTDAVAAGVREIVRDVPDTQVVINLSLDAWGEEHDRIRGVPGGFDKAMETYRALRGLEASNLVLGIHTVISRFNVARFPHIYRELNELAPDSYITEVAEERRELDTVGMDITPSPEEYDRAAGFLLSNVDNHPARGFARITRAFRKRYYRLAGEILRQRCQVIPCYAGWASGHIAPDGDVWTCCIRAESVGNLRDVDYDFGALWFGPQADALRRSIRRGECFCPMANASYTNMLIHAPTLAQVSWDLVGERG